MATGKRRKGIGPVEKWRFDCPRALAWRFENLPGNYDYSYSRPIFGKRSQILTELLEAYVIAEETKLKAKEAA